MLIGGWALILTFLVVRVGAYSPGGYSEVKRIGMTVGNPWSYLRSVFRLTVA